MLTLRVLSESDAHLVVAVLEVTSGTLSRDILLMNCRIYTASLAAWPRATYSASVVEVDTVRSFFAAPRDDCYIQKEAVSHYRLSIFRVAGKVLLADLIRIYGGGVVSDVPSGLLP